MTFRQYIQRRRRSRSFAGHFVHDAKHDPDFPDAATWQEVKEYLHSVHACWQAVSGARRTWRRYRAYLRIRTEAA